MADTSRNLQINVGVKDDASAKMSKIGDSIKSSFAKVSVASGVALAAVSAFAIKSATDFADAGEQIANMSAQTGVSALALSGMKVTADEMGLSVETVTGSIKKMQVGLQAMKGDTAKANDALKPLGLSMKDIKDLKPEEQMFKIGNAIAAIQDPAERTAAAVKFFGKSGTEMIPFFQEGNASLDEMVKHAQDMGLAFDDLSANKAAALDGALDNLNSSIQGATMQIAVALAPAITSLVSAITPWMTTLSDWIAKNPELTATIVGITVGVLALGAAISPLITVVTALGAAIGFIASPIGIAIAVIAALTAGIVYLWQTNEGFRNVIGTIWGAISTTITTIAAGIQAGITSFITSVQAIWTGGWTAVSNFISVTWSTVSSTVALTIQTIQGIIDSGMATIKGVWDGAWNGMKATMDGVVNAVIRAVQNIIKSIGDAINMINKLMQKAQAFGGGVTGVAMAAGAQLSGARAAGGNVQAGRTYLVGERGAELFTPSQSGNIIPNHQLGGGGGVNIVITGNTLLDRNAATKIGDMIIDNLRLQRRLA